MRDSLSDAARAVWDRVVASQGAPRSAADGDALAAYATLVARLADARARVDRDGLIVANDKGQPVPHPALAVEKACQADLSRLAAAIRW